MGRPPYDAFCIVCGKRIRRGGTRCLSCFRAQKSVPRKDRLMDAFIDWLVATRRDDPITRLLVEDTCLEKNVQYQTMTRHILQHGVGGTGLVITQLAAFWTEYINEVGRLNHERVQKFCEICGAPRSVNSLRWCRPCSNRQRSVAMVIHHREAALKRGEKRREDKLLADMMREEITKRGLNIDAVLRALKRKE